MRCTTWYPTQYKIAEASMVGFVGGLLKTSSCTTVAAARYICVCIHSLHHDDEDEGDTGDAPAALAMLSME